LEEEKKRENRFQQLETKYKKRKKERKKETSIDYLYKGISS
jgi:hypothetical protein